MSVFRDPFPAVSVQLSTTPGNVLYTCPAGFRAIIEDNSDLNTSAIDRTVTYHIVRSGDSIAANNKVCDAAAAPKVTTAPSGTPRWTVIGKSLNAGDVLQAFASAGSAITPMGTMRLEAQ